MGANLMNKVTYATRTLDGKTRRVKANVPDGVYNGAYFQSYYETKSRGIGSVGKWDWI